MKKFNKLTLFLVLLMFAIIILSSNVFVASENAFGKILTDGKFVVVSKKI